MKRNRRPRMHQSFGYIGSGNKTSVYNRKSKSPFKKIREIYGDELQRLNPKEVKKNLSFKKLTKKEKLQIRKRIKKQIIKEQRKELIAITIILLIALAIFVLTRYLNR